MASTQATVSTCKMGSKIRSRRQRRLRWKWAPWYGREASSTIERCNYDVCARTLHLMLQVTIQYSKLFAWAGDSMACHDVRGGCYIWWYAARVCAYMNGVNDVEIT